MTVLFENIPALTITAHGLQNPIPFGRKWIPGKEILPNAPLQQQMAGVLARAEILRGDIVEIVHSPEAIPGPVWPG